MAKPEKLLFLATLNQSKKKKKIDITLILSIIAKEKSDRIVKLENLWFLTTLIAWEAAIHRCS